MSLTTAIIITALFCVMAGVALGIVLSSGTKDEEE